MGEPWRDATRRREERARLLLAQMSLDEKLAQLGDEVVQLYLRDPVASVTRPVLQLAGFARIRLAAGESRRVRFRLDPGQLAFHDAKLRCAVEPGAVRVFVGASSRDLRCEGGFEIRGRRRRLRLSEIAPTRVELL
jgi:hypothetical protein